MKNEQEQFEKRLSAVPLKTVPGEWREEILAAARAGQAVSRPVSQASFLSTLNSRLSTLLWPHPKAWAGLAAVWVCIGVMNFSTREAAPRLVEKSAAPSPEMVAELKKQQRMFAELVGGPTVDADRARVYSPRPRSERVEVVG
ncbi:MAG TPA: hypothetical protein VG347_02795 [Verrucomicrobiae bacterium]|nr:hypothetical protein [Verrucomicrobiae bacterium]